jgi:hypothetical protein
MRALSNRNDREAVYAENTRDRARYTNAAALRGHLHAVGAGLHIA